MEIINLTHEDETRRRTGIKMSPVSSADLSIMASPAGSELSSLTYSAVLQQPGEWQLAKGRSKPDKSRIRAERGTGSL